MHFSCGKRDQQLFGNKVATAHSYHPESSSQVEKMNHLIKQQIVKLGQEATLPWPQALPSALLRIRAKPGTKEELSSFEILYGRPYEVQEGTSAKVGDEI